MSGNSDLEQSCILAFPSDAGFVPEPMFAPLSSGRSPASKGMHALPPSRRARISLRGTSGELPVKSPTRPARHSSSGQGTPGWLLAAFHLPACCSLPACACLPSSGDCHRGIRRVLLAPLIRHRPAEQLARFHHHRQHHHRQAPRRPCDLAPFTANRLSVSIPMAMDVSRDKNLVETNTCKMISGPFC